MGLFDSPAQWIALGKMFGLVPYKPTSSFSLGLGFRQIKRSLGLPAWQSAPSFDHWLYGKRGDVEVLLLTFEIGVGSSRSTYTGVLARIDPPLFLGLNIEPKPTFELFAQKRLLSGDAFIDGKIRVQGGFDAARTSELLVTPGHALLHQIASSSHDLHVTDSVVAAVTSGAITDPGTIASQLDTVVALASTLAQRRSAMAPSVHELAQQAEWQRFADAEGFTLDTRRMTLSGTREGSEIKIALETGPEQIHTSVSVRFPQAVHVAFTAVRTLTPAFLQGIFGQDIKVGDKAFDDRFVVTGHPEHIVREALARPELLRVMTLLGQVTGEVQLNHAQLFFRAQGPTASAADLGSMVETGRITCASLFGEVSGFGPYR